MNWSARGNVLNQYSRNTSIRTTVMLNMENYQVGFDMFALLTNVACMKTRYYIAKVTYFPKECIGLFRIMFYS